MCDPRALEAEEVGQCLKSECLTASARNEMVQTLVSILFSKSSRPSRSDHEVVARNLIVRYPFAKDDLGCGYVHVLSETSVKFQFSCLLVIMDR